MDSSSRAFDLPHVLTPDSEKRLLRIFCFLRQHDRKAKAARKLAELQKLSYSGALAPSSAALGSASSSPRHSSHASQPDVSLEATATAQEAALFDQNELSDELNLLTDNAIACSSSTTTATITTQKKSRNEHLLELRRDIRELEKGVVHSSLDASGYITPADFVSAMKAMNRNPTKNEIQWMIWEADEDLDGSIEWHEFKSCYARSLVDKHGLEPNQLYHFIQFLLCDTDGSYTVSVLELKAELKKLPGTDHLVSKLMLALKDDAEEQLLQKFTLSEYLDIMLADLPTSFNIPITKI